MLFCPYCWASRCEGCLAVSSANGHWPVVFGNAAPEDPYHDHGTKVEEGFKEGTVDFTIGGVAEVRADDELENLAQGKQKGGDREVYFWELVLCLLMSWMAVLTHA